MAKATMAFSAFRRDMYQARELAILARASDTIAILSATLRLKVITAKSNMYLGAGQQQIECKRSCLDSEVM